MHEPTDAFGLKIGFTICSDTQGHIEKDSLRNSYPLSYFSSTALCPLRLGPSTRTFFSPGMITWSPVSVCGPVSKQSSAEQLVLCLSHCVVRRVGTESSSVNYFFRPQSESLCWKGGTASKSVLVMHRQEAQESERKLEAVEKRKRTQIHSFIHIKNFCQSEITRFPK